MPAAIVSLKKTHGSKRRFLHVECMPTRIGIRFDGGVIIDSKYVFEGFDDIE